MVTKLQPWYTRYKVDVPEGVCGDWRVARFTVSKADASFERLRVVVTGNRRFVREGTYTSLKRKGTLVMSDTHDEIADHLNPIRKAAGHCLVNGLGLGVVIQAMLQKPEVEHVTVIEAAKEVIELVGPHYQGRFGERLTIVNADAYTWQPPKGFRYNVVWHDIWDNLCEDNLPLMHKLHRKYGRRTEWQGSWGREQLESERRRRKRQGGYW